MILLRFMFFVTTEVVVLLFVVQFKVNYLDIM